jgi:hypothetical protein
MERGCSGGKLGVAPLVFIIPSETESIHTLSGDVRSDFRWARYQQKSNGHQAEPVLDHPG